MIRYMIKHLKDRGYAGVMSDGDGWHWARVYETRTGEQV